MHIMRDTECSHILIVQMLVSCDQFSIGAEKGLQTG